MNRQQQSKKGHGAPSPREAGQSLVFMAFLIVALLGFLVLVTDVGYMYYTKRDLQGIVDASVMAGARRTPTSVDTESEKRDAVDATIKEALGCYARNIGLDASTVPEPPPGEHYDLAPAWNGSSGSNYQYSTLLGGDVVTVTVFYEDAITQQQEIAKEQCVRMDARRNTSMFFAGVLGFTDVNVPASAAGYRGIFKVTWSYRVGADVHATPTYYVDHHATGGSREVVFIGARDGYMYCLDANGFQDGSKKTWAYWRYNMKYNYTGGGTTEGYHLEWTSTGENSRWSMSQSQPRMLDTGSQSLLYFSTVPKSGYFGYLYCLNASTGEKVWSRDIHQPYYHQGTYGMSYRESGPVFSSDKSTVYVASRGGYLCAFNTLTGTPVTDGSWDGNGWVPLYGGTVASPFVESRTDQDAIDHGLDGRSDIIYISCSKPRHGYGSGSGNKGKVYAFYSNGEVKWEKKLSSSSDFQGFDGSPVVYGDTLYIGCRDKYLYAVDKDTGNVKWKYKANKYVSSTPAVEEVDGNVYVYFSSEKATAYKLRDLGNSCSLEWTMTLGLKDPSPSNLAAWHCSPALATDYVYMGCQTRSGSIYGDGGRGYFEAVTKSGGQSDQQFKLDADLHTTLEVAANNWIYFGGCDNLVYGVDLNPANQESKLLW